MPAPPHRSLWLRDVLGDEPDAPALAGHDHCDVAIVGGGYVGLWTAIAVKQLEPGCDVTIIERDICGGGASGRNGGFVLSWWPKFPSLVACCGAAEAERLAKASEDAIGAIGDFCAQHRIDAHFVQRGWLWAATSGAQLDAWEPVVAALERHGIGAFERLAPADVARRSGSPVHRAGVLERRAATVQPAALARGLRRVALELGVRVFERSRVREFSRQRPVVLRTTSDATMRADRVVLAMNAWSANVRELRRHIAVISSDIIATPPIPERLAAIGWTGGESIADSQTMVCYYRTTRDGRIAFGKGGWGIAYAGNIGPPMDRDAARAAMVELDFRRYYPMLASVPVADDWCGPIDRSADALPIIDRLPGSPHVCYGIGWSGNGVGPSYVGGKILASLALDRKDEWSTCGLVGRRYALFPPEPIRFAGAHVVRAAVVRRERAEIDDRRPPWLAKQIAKLAPAGIEDKA